MPLLLHLPLLAICLAGLWFVTSRLLRAALLLQVCPIIINVLVPLLLPRLPLSPLVVFIGVDQIDPYLQQLLNLLSFLALSYGIARWRSPLDWLLAALQVLLGAALLVMQLKAGIIFSFPSSALFTALLVMFPIAVTAQIWVLFLLASRWDCWRKRPLVMACFLAGQLALVTPYLVGLPGTFGWVHYSPAVSTTLGSITLEVSRFDLLLLTLAWLLLVQTERVHQQAGPGPAAGLGRLQQA